MFSPLLSRPQRAYGRRLPRLDVEVLESRECPTGSRLGLTLDALVLPGHTVQLSGSVSGDFTPGATVAFSGAVNGACYVDGGGQFLFTTAIGTLGEISAVTMFEGQAVSDAINWWITTPAPVVTMAISNMTATTVSFSGTLTNVDYANQTLNVSGATQTVTTDAQGNFSFTVPREQLGMVSVSETDLWGQSSNVAQIDGAHLPPWITGFGCQYLETEGYYRLFGYVYGVDVQGLVVTFSGLTQGTATVGANGYFSFVSSLNQNALGLVYAVTQQNNVSSNEAELFI